MSSGHHTAFSMCLPKVVAASRAGARSVSPDMTIALSVSIQLLCGRRVPKHPLNHFHSAAAAIATEGHPHRLVGLRQVSRQRLSGVAQQTSRRHARMRVAPTVPGSQTYLDVRPLIAAPNRTTPVLGSDGQKQEPQAVQEAPSNSSASPLRRRLTSGYVCLGWVGRRQKH